MLHISRFCFCRPYQCSSGYMWLICGYNMLKPTVDPIVAFIHGQRKTTMLLSWGIGEMHHNIPQRIESEWMSHLFSAHWGMECNSADATRTWSLRVGRVLKGFSAELWDWNNAYWVYCFVLLGPGDHHSSSWSLFWAFNAFSQHEPTIMYPRK